MACACGGWKDSFSVAVSEGDEEAVRALLAQDIRLVKRPVARARQTAWHVASAAGHVAILKLLVEAVRRAAGPQLKLLNGSLKRLVGRSTLTPPDMLHECIHLQSTTGLTPLILAAREGKHEAVSYLLSLGADPWQHDRVGMTALHHAAYRGCVPIIEELLQNTRPASSRACSVNPSHTKYVDCMDFCGWVPMHYAVYRGQVEAATALVLRDANIIARSLIYHHFASALPPGCSPLHIAASQGNLPMIQLILRAYYECSADIVPNLLATTERRRRQRSQPDPRLILTRTGRLAFHVALRFGQNAVLEWLDPSIPLMFLLSGSDDAAVRHAGEQAGAGGTGSLVVVPRLTVLAAKALHNKLAASLDAVQQQLQERQRLLEQQRQAEAGKALLAKQAALFKKMISRVVRGARSSRDGQGDGDTSGPNAGAGGGSVAGDGAAGQRAESPAPDPLLATMPALGGRNSRPPTRPVSSRTRPRQQRRLIVQASARYDRGGASAVRASQSRLVQLLAGGINLGNSNEFDTQNQRMGIAIPDNLDDEPVAVFTRSGANAVSSPQTLTAIPMRSAPPAAAAAAGAAGGAGAREEEESPDSPTVSRPVAAGPPVAEVRSPGTPHSQLPDTPRHRHSDPGDMQTLRAALAGDQPVSNVSVALAVAAAASACASPVVSKLGRGGGSSQQARGSGGSSRGSGGGPLPHANGHDRGSGGGSGGGGADETNFNKVSISSTIANVPPTIHATGPSRFVSMGASGLACSVRHSEPGNASEFCFTVVPMDEPPTPDPEEDLVSDAHSRASSFGGAGAISDGRDGAGNASREVPPHEETAAAERSAETAQQAADASADAAPEAGSGVETEAGATTGAGSTPELSSPPPLPDPCAPPAVAVQGSGPAAASLSPATTLPGFVELPEEAAEAGAGAGAGAETAVQGVGSCFLTADGLPHLDLDGVMQDAEVEARVSAGRQGKLAAGNGKASAGTGGGGSVTGTGLGAGARSDAAVAVPSSPAAAAVVGDEPGARSGEAGEGAGSVSEPQQSELDASVCPSAADVAEGAEGAERTPSAVQGAAGAEVAPGAAAGEAAGGKDGIGGLLTSLKKRIKRMSAHVVPLARSQTRGRNTPPPALIRRARSFSSSLALHDEVDALGASIVADEDAVASASGAKAEPDHAGDDDEDEDVCPVCLDEMPNVQVATCRHRLCLGCAKDLCNRYNLTPALCPYCRSIISGFSLA